MDMGEKHPESTPFSLAEVQDIVFVKDLDGRCLMANEETAAVIGLTPDEMVGKLDVEVLPAEVAELQREYDTQIAGGGVPVTFEGPLVRDGERRTMRTTKAPLRDAGDEMIGVIGVSTDVSALRRAEEALRESQAQLAEAQELTSVGSGTWDLASEERCWSDKLYRIFGLDRENGPIGYDEYLELVHADELVGEADAAMYRAKAGSREQGP